MYSQGCTQDSELSFEPIGLWAGIDGRNPMQSGRTLPKRPPDAIMPPCSDRTADHKRDDASGKTEGVKKSGSEKPVRHAKQTGVGALIKAKRQGRGLSQRELAARLHVKPSHVSYLETERRRPSLSLLKRIAEVLGLDPEALLLLIHPEAGSLLNQTREPAIRKASNQAWQEFKSNKGLLSRHQVGPQELKVLAQINLLGKVAAPRQYLFILNCIRQAVDEE